MKQKILMVVLSLTVCLALLEGTARVCNHYVRHRTIEDSIFNPCFRHYFFLGPSFKPNSGGEWQAISELKINSLGFRGEEISLRKDRGVFRIICFGGSTSHAGNYPQKLSTLLDRHVPPAYQRVEVINAAVPTWNTTQSLIQFITRAVYLEPDLIVVYHAVNDAGMTDYHWLHHLPQVEYEKYGGFLINHSLLFNFFSNRFEKLKSIMDYKAWESSVEESSPQVASEVKEETLTNPSTQVFRMNITNFILLAQNRGIKTALCTMPLNHDPKSSRSENASRAGFAYRDFSSTFPKVQQLNGVLRELANQYGVILIDAAQSGMNQDPSNFSDLCHFSEKGAQTFAELVRDGIESHIAP